MREIILDTETTGLKALGDDRVIEIACLEIINKKQTGNTFHVYINPERDVPLEATRVHNITTSFLLDKPVFSEIADDFLNFIAGDPLVIHNAPFDMGFLNAELKRLSLGPLPKTRAFCTLALARQKFPGAGNSLDALCKRFRIDLSKRKYHGALVDCELLAQVYVELLGGRQGTLAFAPNQKNNVEKSVSVQKIKREARTFPMNEQEHQDHLNFIETLKDPLWKKI